LGLFFAACYSWRHGGRPARRQGKAASRMLRSRRAKAWITRCAPAAGAATRSPGPPIRPCKSQWYHRCVIDKSTLCFPPPLSFPSVCPPIRGSALLQPSLLASRRPFCCALVATKASIQGCERFFPFLSFFFIALLLFTGTRLQKGSIFLFFFSFSFFFFSLFGWDAQDVNTEVVRTPACSRRRTLVPRSWQGIDQFRCG